MFIGCNSTKLKFRTWTSFIMTGNFGYNCKKERELVISTSCALHLINFDLIFKRFRSYDISITSIFAETLAYLVYAKSFTVQLLPLCAMLESIFSQNVKSSIKKNDRVYTKKRSSIHQRCDKRNEMWQGNKEQCLIWRREFWDKHVRQTREN